MMNRQAIDQQLMLANCFKQLHIPGIIVTTHNQFCFWIDMA